MKNLRLHRVNIDEFICFFNVLLNVIRASILLYFFTIMCESVDAVTRLNCLCLADFPGIFLRISRRQHWRIFSRCRIFLMTWLFLWHINVFNVRQEIRGLTKLYDRSPTLFEKLFLPTGGVKMFRYLSLTCLWLKRTFCVIYHCYYSVVWQNVQWLIEEKDGCWPRAVLFAVGKGSNPAMFH